jgi:hypothetical protein
MSVLEMKTIPGICKLCGENSELQNSHIIPEFFYDLIYDENPRRFRSVPADPSEKIKYEQQGICEHLFCKDCDNRRLGQWEDYVKRAFIDGKIVDGKRPQAVKMRECVVLQNLDYKKFKLFLLSLLWRMSIAKHDFFANVNLGQQHEGKIHKALLDEDPLRPEEYPCTFEFLTLGGKHYQDLILKPYCLRGTFRVYLAIISGIRFSFFVGGCAAPEPFVSMAINQQNELIIGQTEIRDDSFLHNALLEFVKRKDLTHKKQLK